MNAHRNQFFYAGLAGLLIGALGSFIVDRSTAPHAEPIDFAIARQRQLAADRSAAFAAQERTCELQCLQNNARVLDALLPTDPQIDALLQQVCQLASVNSLRVTQIKPLPGRQLTAATDLPVSLAIDGNFNGFYSFLLQLEALPRLKHLSHLQIHKSPEHNGDIQATMTMDVYSDLIPATAG